MTGRRVEMKESSVFSDKSILPACRIQCEPGHIKIGDKEYQSASEALNAYLDQFDTPETNSRYSLRSNNSLESSVLKIQQHKIINDEIQKAKQGIKIEVLKKALDKSKKREQGYLQKEVDDALAKSGELLDRLNATDDSIQQCPSDLGSLTTDILLTVNPYKNLQRSESTHVYSYHRTSRSPTPTCKSTSQSTNQNTPSDGSKSKLPPTGLGANKSKSATTATLKHGRALRSRSVSPTSGKSFKTPSWVQELDNSANNGSPSWIDGLAASDISDSIWTDKTRLNPQDDKLRTLPEETSSYLNSTTPGLNYSDLHSKTPDSKPQSFSELRTYTANLISKADKFLKESELNESKSLDTDMSSTHQPCKMTPKRKGLHTTLDKYIADMSSPFSGKKDSESIENMPRCSSMDNMMGDDFGPKSDITGASTIPMASNPVTPKKSSKPTVTFSPYHIGKSPNSSAILDGDRPWENPPFKAPVQVDRMSPVPIEMSNKVSKSPTLSGGQQPGSLEALKKMLFKLQAESNTVQTDSYISQNDVNPAKTLDMPALKGYNFESEPGGHSLEKALVHLSRLKSLVEKKDSFIQDSVLDKSSHSAPSSPRR